MEEFGKKALTTLRTLASGDKYRLEKDEFDLDLTYVTHRVIAMGFPADKLVEQAYRNHIDEVAEFFECHHSNHYMIFNLTEKHYDPGKFRNRVRFYGWPDHHPPPMSLLHDVVKAVHEWLEEDRLNVAAIHCKAGLGRTGTVISSYFLYAGFITAPEESMEFFGASRSQSARGVKVPSQRRCVNYLHQILTQTKSLDVVHRPKRLVLKRIEMMPVPDVDMIKGGFWPVVELVDMHRFHSPFFLKKAHRMYSGRKGDASIVMDLNVPIAGDVLIRVYHFQDLLIGKSYPRLIFRYGFHTSFVEDNRLMIPVTELDGAGHGQFSSDSFPSNFVLLNTFAEATSQPQPDLEVGAQGGVAARRMPLSPPHRLMILGGAASPYSSGKPSEAEAEDSSDDEERELKAALRMARLEDDRHRKEEKRRSRQAINLNRRSQPQQQPPPPWDASFCSPMPHRPLLLHPRPSDPAPSAQQNPPHQQPRELPHMVPLSQQRPQPVNHHQPPPAATAAAYNPFHGPHQAQAQAQAPSHPHQPQHQPPRPSDAAQSRADGQASALHPFFDQLLPEPAPGGVSSATAAGSGAAGRPQPIRIACQSPRRRTPSPADTLAQLTAPSPAPTLPPPPAHSPAAAPLPVQQPMGATLPPQHQPPSFFAPPQMNQHPRPHPHPPHQQNHPPAPAPAHDLFRFPSSPHLVSLNFPSPGVERRQGQDAQQQRYLNELTAPASPVPPPAWDHPPHAVSVWAQRQMEEQREWRRLSGGPEPPYHRLQVPCALPSPSPLAAAPPHFQPVAFPAGAQPPVFATAAPPTVPAGGSYHHHHQQPQLLSPSAYLPSSSPGVSLHHHHHNDSLG